MFQNISVNIPKMKFNEEVFSGFKLVHIDIRFTRFIIIVIVIIYLTAIGF
jgi:hypothetical protein